MERCWNPGSSSGALYWTNIFVFCYTWLTISSIPHVQSHGRKNSGIFSFSKFFDIDKLSVLCIILIAQTSAHYWYPYRSCLRLIICLWGTRKWFFTSEIYFLSPQKRIIRLKQDQKTRTEVELGISEIVELQWFLSNLFLFFIYSLLWRICLKCTNWTCLD